MEKQKGMWHMRLIIWDLLKNKIAYKNTNIYTYVDYKYTKIISMP